ncbi:MAG: NYN domain-containing protein [Chloroflexi bacterium]|nr:NYN domain-containing protein [Chloroflexota bacterium]
MARRVALFLDFENLYTTLKNRTAGHRNPYGFSPRMNFEHLVDYIESRYGTLAREDFIAVANFSHYNPQLGGLNRVATVIDAQSFMAPKVRSRRQRSPGKRWVIRDFADMRLAFEIGQHVATRPADIYILGSGDEAFTAIGRTLREMGFEVLFLVADTESSATDANILSEFSVIDFLVTQRPEEEDEPTDETEPETEPETTNPHAAVVDLLTHLRRELRTGIPVDLLYALLPPGQGETLVRRAHGAGAIDLWESPEGIRCASLRSERLYDQVQPLSVREDVAEAARVFRAVADLAPTLPTHPDRATWRRALKARLGLSNRQVKRLLQRLLDAGVLLDADLAHPRLTRHTLYHWLKSSPHESSPTSPQNPSRPQAGI